jgi:hypothetical protein
MLMRTVSELGGRGAVGAPGGRGGRAMRTVSFFGSFWSAIGRNWRVLKIPCPTGVGKFQIPCPTGVWNFQSQYKADETSSSLPARPWMLEVGIWSFLVAIPRQGRIHGRR